MIRTQVSPRAYFAQEWIDCRHASKTSKTQIWKRFDRSRPMQKKSAKYSNLFIGHSVKRSFVRSFMMSYLSGKKSRLILHSIVPNILYKGRWLFMLLSKSRNFFWSKRYLIFFKVLDFYQKKISSDQVIKISSYAHKRVQSKIYVRIVAFLPKSWNII